MAADVVPAKATRAASGHRCNGKRLPRRGRMDGAVGPVRVGRCPMIDSFLVGIQRGIAGVIGILILFGRLVGPGDLGPERPSGAAGAGRQARRRRRRGRHLACDLIVPRSTRPVSDMASIEWSTSAGRTARVGRPAFSRVAGRVRGGLRRRIRRRRGDRCRAVLLGIERALGHPVGPLPGLLPSCPRRRLPAAPSPDSAVRRARARMAAERALSAYAPPPWRRTGASTASLTIPVPGLSRGRS